MHIVFFNRAFYPEESATSQLLQELTTSLYQEYDCDVTVVSGVPQGCRWTPSKGARNPLVQKDKWQNVVIYRAQGTQLDKHTFWKRAINYLTYVFSAWFASWRVKRPSVVISQTDPPVIGIIAWMLAAWHRVPFVMCYQDIFPEVARLVLGANTPVLDWFFNRVNRFLMGRAKRIVVIGHAMKDRLLDKGADAEKIVVISNWSDGTLIQPGPKDNAFAQEYKLTNHFVVMHSGNMGLSQNLEYLVDAAEYLQDLEDLKIVLVGSGVGKEALAQRAKTKQLANLQMIPYQPKERLTESFTSADVHIISLKPNLAGCILPSKLYGILAAGRPYIAAVDPACDVARLAEAEQCGLVAQTSDAKDLADKIRVLYNDRKATEQMGARARAAYAPFDKPQSIRAYFELFSALNGAK